MRRKLLVAIIFLIGVGVFTFPLISNWYNNRLQYNMIEGYEDKVGGLSDKIKEKRLQDAAAFNNRLASGSIAYLDPFSASSKQKEGGAVKYPEGFLEGEVIGAVEIPKISVKLPILLGVSDKILAKGVGYLPSSSLPVGGKGVHTVLTGHRGLPTAELFRNLDKLNKGDVFYVKSLGRTLAYKVDQIKVVEPEQVEDLAIIKDKDYTTLITCEPYMINTHRMLVRGHRIPFVSADEAMDIESFFMRYLEYIISLALILLIIIILIIRDRRKAKRDTE